VEKRPADSSGQSAWDRAPKGLFDQAVSFRHRVETHGLTAHVDRTDIDNLLRLRLSETKAALLERHLASCDQCQDLVLRILEERVTPPSIALKNAREQV
jgi:hypothetical protein